MSDDQKNLQELLIEKNKVYKNTILCAEDDKINAFLMERILKPLGFNLDIAENGLIAVELCKQKQYDIILMDIYMPVMDGLEASKQIKANSTTIPIIAVTAGIFNKNGLKLEFGIDYLINKPVGVFELIKLLNELI